MFFMLAVTTKISSTSPCLQAYEELSTLLAPLPRLKVRPIENLEELKQLHAIDADAYQECSITFECFQGWWERHQQGNTVVFSGDDIVASIGLWAISEEQSAAFIEGGIRESDFMPVSFEQCESVPQQNWYASGIVLKKHLRRNLKNNPIKMLLERAIGEWFDSGRAAYPLRVIALAEYVEGENLLTRFNFMKIRDKANLPDGCDIYCLQLNSEEDVESLLKSRRLW